MTLSRPKPRHNRTPISRYWPTFKLVSRRNLSKVIFYNLGLCDSYLIFCNGKECECTYSSSSASAAAEPIIVASSPYLKREEMKMNLRYSDDSELTAVICQIKLVGYQSRSNPKVGGVRRRISCPVSAHYIECCQGLEAAAYSRS